MSRAVGGTRGTAVMMSLMLVSGCSQEMGRTPLAPPLDANADLAPAIGWTPRALGLPGVGFIDGGASDVNDAGVIAGEAFASGGSEPFIRTPAGAFVRLPTTTTFPYGSPRSINNEGFVVGQIYNPPSRSSAVLWSPGGAQVDLIPGLDPGSNPWAHEVNDKGQVAGEGALASDPSRYVGYRYSRRSGLEVLPTLGGAHGAAYAINAGGAIVGVSMASDFSYHPTQWSSTNVPIDLGRVPGAYAEVPVAINSAGVVVGYSYDVGFTFQPIVWRTPGRPEVLRVPQGARSALTSEIDDYGRIYGWAFMPQRVAVVWTPGAGPKILPQATGADAIPQRSSRCGKIAGRSTGQWVVWERAC